MTHDRRCARRASPCWIDGGPDYPHAPNSNTQGELEAYSNVYERWQLVVRGAKAVQTEANTPLEPDRTLPLRPGAALDITGVDDQHCVQGNSFRRKGAGAGGGGGKRGLPPGL